MPVAMVSPSDETGESVTVPLEGNREACRSDDKYRGEDEIKSDYCSKTPAEMLSALI